MLTELRIRNFAIIESVTLPLGHGFNVLSGETGAGKSIIVGALGLLLGERASADLIRSGAEKATVEGVFDVAKVRASELADERGIDSKTIRWCSSARSRRTEEDAHGSTALRDRDGAGRDRESVVNLHGQHDAQTLLDGESQRRS